MQYFIQAEELPSAIEELKHGVYFQLPNVNCNILDEPMKFETTDRVVVHYKLIIDGKVGKEVKSAELSTLWTYFFEANRNVIQEKQTKLASAHSFSEAEKQEIFIKIKFELEEFRDSSEPLFDFSNYRFENVHEFAREVAITFNNRLNWARITHEILAIFQNVRINFISIKK